MATFHSWFCNFFIYRWKCYTVQFDLSTFLFLQQGNAKPGNVIESYYHLGINFKEILLVKLNDITFSALRKLVRKPAIMWWAVEEGEKKER